MLRRFLLGSVLAGVLVCSGVSGSRGQAINPSLASGADLSFRTQSAKPAATRYRPAPHRLVRHTYGRRRARKPAVVKPAPRPESERAQMNQLRISIIGKLQALDSPPQAIQPGTPARSGSSSLIPAAPLTFGAMATSVPAQPRPACPPTFAKMANWKGEVGFPQRLEQLRRQIADSHAAPADIAALSEFYLGYGMPGEALQATQEGLQDSAKPEEVDRLTQDADLARLMARRPIAASSPLLNNPATCDRPDLALWQALSAAVSHDPAGVERAGAGALASLRQVPEPALERLAFVMADAVPDNSPVLPGIAKVLRNAQDSDPIDVAASLLLRARIAEAKGNRDDATALLRSAASMNQTVPGLRARARLAELQSTGNGPDSTRDETILADIARVYRDDAIGQRAAAYLAERKLRQGKYQAALAIADQSASSEGAPLMDSRGAALVARILRVLLVESPKPDWPSAAERVALYLRYQGYATPGPKGDDIRLAAAQLLLQQGMPSTALTALRQLSEPAASLPAAEIAHATAETRAGDPAVALILLRTVPPSDDAQRATAEAFARLDDPAKAADQLAGLTGITDRLWRARLLCDAKEWNAAANAYLDLLRNPALTGADRTDAVNRYGLALALSGGSPDPNLPVPSAGLAARILASLPEPAPSAGGRAQVGAVRGALQRAKEVQSLLPEIQSNRGS